MPGTGLIGLGIQRPPQGSKSARRPRDEQLIDDIRRIHTASGETWTSAG
ncbi:hypothetical protein ACFRFU_09650 [Streptomyces sp. NPDC056704]